MSRLEDIDNAIWSDPDFEALSADATLLYLWSFTNPRCGMAGVYKVSRRGLEESKVTGERLDVALTELAAAKFCFYENDVLFVRSRVKHLRQKTEPIAKSIRSDVRKLSESHPLRAKFVEEYGNVRWLAEWLTSDALSTVPSGSGEGQGFTAPRRNSVTLTGRSRDRQGQGQGQGQGKGPSREGVQGEGTDWMAWAAEHLPDLPQEYVFGTVARLAGGSKEVTPELVRQGVLAAHPHLAQEATA